jgi:hypothetical protein
MLRQSDLGTIELELTQEVVRGCPEDRVVDPLRHRSAPISRRALVQSTRLRDPQPHKSRRHIAAARKVSQRKIAARLGLHHSTIAEWLADLGNMPKSDTPDLPAQSDLDQIAAARGRAQPQLS